MAIRANTANSEKPGSTRMPNASTWPKMMAPRNVPQNEPRPPITTTMNASTMISTSIPGTMLRTGVTSAPPSPARNDPPMNMSVYSLPTSAPSTASISRS